MDSFHPAYLPRKYIRCFSIAAYWCCCSFSPACLGRALGRVFVFIALNAQPEWLSGCLVWLADMCLGDGVGSRNPPRPELVKEILSYFLQNPQAVDDLEGVARWRLHGERIRQQVADAEEALSWLAEQGFLEKISSPVSGPVYRLNEANRSAGEHFMEASEKSARKPRGN